MNPEDDPLIRTAAVSQTPEEVHALLPAPASQCLLADLGLPDEHDRLGIRDAGRLDVEGADLCVVAELVDDYRIQRYGSRGFDSSLYFDSWF